MPPLLSTSPVAGSSLIIRAGAGAARWTAQPLQVPVVVASFSTTASRSKFTKSRRLFREWERKSGRIYRRHTSDQPTYLLGGREDNNADRPFPHNQYFKSAKVLDEKARELIWEKIMREGETIKGVSAEFGIDIRRVAAIVRLKEVEKDWIAKVSWFCGICSCFPLLHY